MKNLIQNFKEFFNSYDFNNKSVAVDQLIIAVDIILDMMMVIDLSDTEHVKKLSSFTKVLSSGFCNDMMNQEMIVYMYNTKVVPILEYLDNKYDKSEDVEEDESYINIFDSKGYLKNDDMEKYKNNPYTSHIVVYNDIKEERNKIEEKEEYTEDDNSVVNRNKKNNVFFQMMKETSNKLYLVYNKMLDSLNNNSTIKYRDNIDSIKATISVAKNNENESINMVYISMYHICNILDKALKDKNIKRFKEDLDLLFEYINKVSYIPNK